MSANLKKLGGLGVISLAKQNSALLSKFLTKIHSSSDVPWASWFRRFYGWSPRRDLGDDHHLDTPIWKYIASGLSAFRRHSLVTLGCGTSTSFWTDQWIGSSSLADRFPTLFSHSTRPNISVFLALDSPMSDSLVPRLSTTAASELDVLQSILEHVLLDPDK